ncbi:MAG: hypothetical protein ACYTAO_07820, partial [Planctomycetota bacterium]
MKKTIPLDSRKAGALVLVLALGLSEKVAKADYFFRTPTNLGPTVNSSAWDGSPAISADGLTLYFRSMRPGPHVPSIWLTTRPTRDDPWNTPVNAASLLSSRRVDGTPCISADGLTFYFMSGRQGGYGNEDIWACTRETTEQQWGPATNLGELVNSPAAEWRPSVSADGLTLFFESNRAGGYGDYDLYFTTRPTVSAPWGPAENLGPTVNHERLDRNPSISADGLTLFFTSDRPGGYGSQDIWMTRRPTTGDPWTEPVNLGPRINSSAAEGEPSISADGRTLYFSDWPDARPGGVGNNDLWQASMEPVVDLNGDEIVDSVDMCIMVDHWGTDEPLCDIGPTPLGDGVVDVQDLVVLAEHLFEEIFPPELTAYWKLNETEGNVAHESISGSDDVVMGGPLWQPTGGKVDGALELDGVDDCVISSSGPNPADPEISSGFSVFAWVKGGAPGQVIIS